ncbi:MAG: PAS domain S-box protein, partial [Perlabentimonas sp.]
MATDWEEYRKRIIGLGDTSTRKSYYPDLQEKIKALEESQENIVSIYNAVSDGIVIHTDSGEVVSLNNRAKSIFNLCDTEENLITSKFNLLSVADNPNKLTIGFSKAAKGGTSIVELNITADRKANEIPVQFSTNRISWNEQEMLISIIRDFSSRKKYEKKLIEARENAESNEERFRMLFNNMNSAFAYHKIITNKKGEPVNYEYIEVNSQFEKITGLKAEDVVGNKVLDLLPDLEPIWIEMFGQVALSGKAIEYTDYVNSFGKYLRFKAYCPNKGFFALTFTDVTDEIRSKEALRISEERYNLALEAVNDGVWDWHIPTGRVFFDARYFTISGYKPNEFTHDFSEWEKRIHPDDLAKAKEAIQSQLSTGSQGIDIEFRFKRKEGDWMWIRGRGKVVERDVKGSPIRMVGTHTDITDKKLIEQELVDYKNNLEFVVQERTEELEATNEELTSINEELLDKRNELEAALDKLKDAQKQMVL